MFRPLWVRLAIVAVCIAWAVIEYVAGATSWAMIAAAAAVYGAWSLIWAWKPDDDAPRGDGE